MTVRDDGLATFTINIDDRQLAGMQAQDDDEEEVVGRRRYVTHVVHQHAHEAGFGFRVIKAYRRHCATCRLRRQELLEAAHILPDGPSLEGPIVPNGLALCSLHHGAFDAHILGVTPDVTIEIRADVLKEKDGPMLIHGLQTFHGKSNRVARMQVIMAKARVHRGTVLAIPKVGLIQVSINHAHPRLSSLLCTYPAARCGWHGIAGFSTEALSEQFALTPAERQEKIPSGVTTYIRNRVGWAMTYLTKAGLIEKVATKTYSVTTRGQEFLAAHPNGFGIKQLATIPEFKAFHQSAGSRDQEDGPVEVASITPLERIDRALEDINTELRAQLLTELLQKPPLFFEQVVLDVLVAMGYGGSRENAAERLGGVGDEGVDGRINQDPLGLDVVLVQAKRYAPDNVIGREKLQQFVGALHGQGASKGIFITTSRFAVTVEEFVSRGSSLKVVLIDGDRLTRLMLQYRIGVRIERHADVLALDNNYFDED